jgi:hypothetical protein
VLAGDFREIEGLVRARYAGDHLDRVIGRTGKSGRFTVGFTDIASARQSAAEMV